MDDTLTLVKEEMEEAIKNMEKRFSNVRAGRANASVLDGVLVNYYGVPTPLIQLATVSIPEARTLMIKPFDKSSLANIEKAIFDANIGFTPNNNGESVILSFPQLTEEKRKEYVKQVREMAEDARIVLRTIRQNGNDSIKKEAYSEDEEKRGTERVQNLINESNDKIEKLLKEKENELMTI
jgi:ribosome recycling factor